MPSMREVIAGIVEDVRGENPAKKQEKWQPKLRYVKDRFGIPDSFHKPNRQMRRATAAMYRNGFIDQSTGEYIKGIRVKTKKTARRIARTRNLKVMNYGGRYGR